jgi:hypothetical protein
MAKHGSRSRGQNSGRCIYTLDGGDSVTQRALDAFEAERERRAEGQRRRKAVTLPQLRCLEDHP